MIRTRMLFVVAATFFSVAASAASLTSAQVNAARSLVAGKPNIYAASIPVKIAPAAGEWTTDGGNDLWKTSISAVGAVSIGFFAQNVHLPAASTITVISAGRKDVFASEKLRRNFTMPLVPGESLTIELRIPSSGSKSVSFNIISVDVSPSAPTVSAKAAATGCQDAVNYECRRDATNELASRATGALLLRISSAVAVCTGSLINPIGLDANYLLTATHCREGEDVLDLTVLWGASAACGDLNFNRLAADEFSDSFSDGATLLMSYRDVSLYKLDSVPPEANAWRAGFNATVTPTGNSFFGVHHARGAAKQWVRDADGAVQMNTFSDLGPVWRLTANFANGDGVTSSGSSGSGLFDADQNLLGTLYGGDGRSCSNYGDGTTTDYYSALFAAWDGGGTPATSLKPWLDPANSGKTSNTGVAVPNIPSPIDGDCGSAQGVSTTAYPASGLCATGTASSTDSTGADGSFDWKCSGTNGGAAVMCSAQKVAVVNGGCGTANGVSVAAYPASGFCSTGTYSKIDDKGADGKFDWLCSGSNGGTNQSCAAPKLTPIDGSCGAANGVSADKVPTSGLCAVGTSAVVDGVAADGSFNWTCSGANGGQPASCAAPKYPPVDGSCGAANNTVSARFPSSGLCSVGTTSNTDTAGADGTFNWSCVGEHGGATTFCAATKQDPGQCGAAAGTTQASFPSSGLCAVGSVATVDGVGADGSFNWTCSSPTGTASCAANHVEKVDGACGGSNGTSSSTFPQSNLCLNGTATASDTNGQDGSYNWSCSGSGGGAPASCAATRVEKVDGKCGNPGPSINFPTGSACAAGSLVITDQNATDGSFNWNCAGSGDGTTASCSTTRTVQVNGTCGSASGVSTEAFPSVGLCATGSAIGTDTAGADGEFDWDCRGANGGAALSCAAPKAQSNAPDDAATDTGQNGGSLGLTSLLGLLFGAFFRRSRP